MQLLFIIIPQINNRLQTDPLVRFFNIVKMSTLVVINKLLGLSPSIQFHFEFNGVAFKMHLSTISDIAVLKEIFILEEYKISLPAEPKTILDLGGHIGDTALYFHAQYPNAKIYSVEPDPELYARLCKNTAAIENIIPIRAAVGEADGEISFYKSSRSSLSGSLGRRSETDLEIKVPVLTLQTLMGIHNLQKVDLCKFDIEGGEQHLFVEKGPKFYAKSYIGEIHSDLMGETIEDYVANFSDYVSTLTPLSRSHRYSFEAHLLTSQYNI